MAFIQEKTLQDINFQITRINNGLSRMVNQYEQTTNWEKVMYAVRRGEADKYLIGDELFSTLQVGNTKYAFPWVVIDNNRECEWEDGSKHPGLWLCAKYLPPFNVDFDAPENERATEETALDGVNYYGFGGPTTSNIPGGVVKLDLNPGDTIPYSDHSFIVHNELEFSVAEDGRIGLDIYNQGFNRYSHSAVRQWLNSDQTSGNWWKPMHVGDCAPSVLSQINGFKYYLESNFKNVVSKVKVQTNYNEDVDITYDHFFPLSMEEMYLLLQQDFNNFPKAGEGTAFPYFKKYADALTGGSTATAGGGLMNLRKKVCGSNSYPGYALRTRQVSTTSNVLWAISVGNMGGGISTAVASSTNYQLPACVIS